MRGYPILFARIIYGASWFFLSPYIPYLLSEFSAPKYFANLIPLSFFVTAAIMQIPAGLISTRLGMKNTYTLGLIIMGISDSLIGLSKDIGEVLFLYALTGFGASFFFSSAGGTLALINEGRTILVMGLYNAMFSVGGILGLNWGFVDSLVGFTYASLLLGSLTIIAGIINYVISYQNVKPEFKVLKNRNVFLVALSTVGVWGSYYVVSEYFPTFSYYVLGESSIITGSLSSLLLLSSVIGGVFTFTFSFIKNDKLRIIISSILGVIPVVFLYNYFLIGLVIMGIFNEMAISIIYAFVVKEVRSENSSLALAEVNSIQIGLGMLELLLPYLSLEYLWYLVIMVSLLPLLILINVR
ncbi:MFS transporter [Sulfurisphaera ohwakuensis]|uniref:MFS transporter n=1 Tax=Sulfurisphaera ohwakuensis TaxID=69656 RepID=UPI0036F420ED